MRQSITELKELAHQLEAVKGESALNSRLDELEPAAEKRGARLNDKDICRPEETAGPSAKRTYRFFHGLEAIPLPNREGTARAILLIAKKHVDSRGYQLPATKLGIPLGKARG